MKNKLKRILSSGQTAIGTWISMTDPYGVEMVAGFNERGHHLVHLDVEGGVQVTSRVTIECQGSDKPVCVAETVARYYA